MKLTNTLFTAIPLPVVATAALPQQMPGESNLPYLFAIYAITWIAFFGYVIYMSHKQQALKRDLDALKAQLEKKPPTCPRAGK